ncbi:hypothetical protein HJC23_008450 [Cyclotella cryptica]|uniref:Uncharacterized protein n=1 Tax=Cyclotella cryptica TaxID=29204 RepID=A0ABD3QWI6_9STRA|eukprot:CCRYP_001176-RA/>CCRYP_001176-RA protein AED:0.39 eAED:0.39 QI:0/-1/0/1/-1/1/1/0/170
MNVSDPTSFESPSAMHSPRSKGTSSHSGRVGLGSTATSTRSSTTRLVGHPVSPSGSVSGSGGEVRGDEPSLGKFTQSLAEWLTAKFSDLLDQERKKYEHKLDTKDEEMTDLHSKISKLTGYVGDLSENLRELEEKNIKLERELHLQNKEMVRIEAESASMKAFMKASLNL